MIDTFVIIGSILDIYLTYLYLGVYKKKFPKKDYTVIEANPLVRYLIRLKGLGEGILLSGTLIVFILFIILHILPYHWKFFLAGVYYMMVTFHLTNFLAIKKMKEVKKNGKEKNKD